jgi:hypothetical protein
MQAVVRVSSREVSTNIGVAIQHLKCENGFVCLSGVTFVPILPKKKLSHEKFFFNLCQRQKPKMKSCGFCRRKYVREEKLASHIEMQHPTAALHENTFSLSISWKQFLLRQVALYVNVAMTLSTYGRSAPGDIEKFIQIYLRGMARTL